jgi:Lon protease-like protein
MFDDEHGLDADVLGAVPIFPLPNTVLLPGVMLPLNVFEPRYLELVDYALEGGQYIGVPLLKPGFESDYEGRPEVEAVFGVGRLLSHQRLPDGRRLIRLAGQRRLRIRRELPPTDSFRLVECALLEEDHPTDDTAREVLGAQLERIASTMRGDDREIVESVMRIPDARVLAYAVAAVLPTLGLPGGGFETADILAMQQATLDADTADARVAVLSEFTAELTARLRDDKRIPKLLLN